MEHKVTVAYYSIGQGVMQQQKGVVAMYYGKVFKIPKGLFSEEGDVDFQKDIEELLEELQNKGLEPMLNESTVERYETWEVEGEGVWVMYRVPCKRKHLAQ